MEFGSKDILGVEAALDEARRTLAGKGGHLTVISGAGFVEKATGKVAGVEESGATVILTDSAVFNDGQIEDDDLMPVQVIVIAVLPEKK